MNNNGVCFFAYNNEHIDYVKLSLLPALHVKRFMKNNNTCLITSEGDFAWLEQTQPKDLIDQAFDEVVITNVDHRHNIRTHHDSPWTKFDSQFKNSNKHLINTYSPFDRTLLLDIDYFVRNDSLDYLFDSEAPVAMYDRAHDLRQELPHLYEQYLNPTGIPMWWSTLVYFDKSDTSNMFFDLWAHVSENYDFYKFLYGFPGQMFRTDYCVSIAAHIMNGMVTGDVIHRPIDNSMQYMDQKDDIVEIKTADDWVFLSNDRREQWNNLLVRNKQTNLHVMNKRSIDRHFNKMLESVYNV